MPCPADGCISIDVGSQLDFDDIVLSQRQRGLRIRSAWSMQSSKKKKKFETHGALATHARGEKWATVLLTEIHVGNAKPRFVNATLRG